MHDFFQEAYTALMCCDLSQKIQFVRVLHNAWQTGQCQLNHESPIQIVNEAGRPTKPHLVSPLNVEKRKISSPEGQAALLHAITHIEFNAINLALDAAYRFRNLPMAYYADWLQIAVEEAYHFELLNTHLKQHGYQYGDFTAHNGLWEMAQKTAHDPLIRMALVPRLMEARGLDVTPPIMRKFEQAGNTEAVEILKIILHDEIGHVRIGNTWFVYLCQARQLNPIETFQQLLADPQYNAPTLPKKLNKTARLQAGFSLDELAILEHSI